MELRNVLTFLKAAQLKNFTQVAKELDYVPSTVTMQIQQLETELGFLLFDRIGKGVELTPLGQEFMDYANEIATISEKVRLLGVTPAKTPGTVRIGVLESLCGSVLVPRLRRYSLEFPHISMEIKIGATTDLFTMLKKGELDLIFILGEKIMDKDCTSVYEKQEKIVFVAPANHPLSKKRNTLLRELLQEPMILTEQVGLYRRALSSLAAMQNLLIEPLIELNDTQFICELVAQGLGLSFLPEYSVRKEVEQGTIAILDTAVQLPYFWAQIFHRKNKWLSPALKGLIRTMTE
ncbi:MAG: LysR family transcriptional regulator [Lawsonibacter sp.]